MCSLPAKYECHTLVCAPQPVGYKHNISRGNKSLYYSYCSSGSLLVLDCCSDLIFPHKIWYFNKNVCKVVQMLHKVAKLKFCGTISWYFNQEVDENINNWRKYKRLLKTSILTKNVNFDENFNLTKISIWRKCQFWRNCQFWQK